ncbi:hypothetical protein SAMN04488034_101586 [Salinimicrobium catena]|uniref:Uncharacterized protein n=1 Tax=Salinimicrobium catena TaxID=390640 RepID=A0A1H5J117_9FLAO|nr:hypothetical protein SAMN04488140_101585 [Salinimicrobium catena]SEE45977.1 hypothetical protein SAMN04488034_101586 [Salinimicrobium catena]
MKLRQTWQNGTGRSSKDLNKSILNKAFYKKTRESGFEYFIKFRLVLPRQIDEDPAVL